MQEHDEWLRIAKEDLLMAKLALPNELFSSLAYHCQQCAEKALKGYLAFKGHEVIKTHDLVKLIVLCSKFDKAFEKNYDLAEQLNPFSTRFRYPTEFDIPDLADSKLAVKHAQSILNFVLKKISEPLTGQKNIFNELKK
jgi:HEPN domain-containing protein